MPVRALPSANDSLPSVLDWLASLASPTSGVPEALALTDLAPLAASLTAHLEATVAVTAPRHEVDQRQWLRQLAQLERASFGLARLEGVSDWAPALRISLLRLLEARRPAVEALPASRQIVLRGRAQDDTARPWSWLQAVSLSAPDLEVLEAWQAGLLAPEDAALVARRIDSEPAWQKVLSELADEEDPSGSETALEQTWELLTRVRRLSDRADAGEALDESAALEVALEAARALSSDDWTRAFTRAREDSEGLHDTDPMTARWVACGLAVRLSLDVLASALLAHELFKALDQVDARLASEGPALAVLSEEAYDEATSVAAGQFPPGWVGWRHARERQPAAPWFEPALQRWGQAEARRLQQTIASLMANIQANLAVAKITARDRPEPRKALRQGAAAVVAMAASDDVTQKILQLQQATRAQAPDALRRVQDALRKTPCRWWRHDVVEALERLALVPGRTDDAARLRHDIKALPGETALLVAIAGSQLGDVWQLRVHQAEEPGDPWEHAGALREVAREAIRHAFQAASAWMPHRMPPRSFEHHRVELLGGNLGIDAIDGSSLGLAATLAFASLWLDVPLTEDMAASASLNARSQEWHLQAVGYIEAKAHALSRATAGHPVRLLLAGSHLAPLPEGVMAVAVTSVADALVEAGLSGPAIDEARRQYTPWLGTLSDRLEQLDRYHKDVELQKLGPGDAVDPWQALGDRLRMLVDSLPRTPDEGQDAEIKSKALRGRIDAALAFTHALDTMGAEAMLADLPPADLPPELAVVAQMVALNHAIDRCSFQGQSWSEAETQVAPLRAALATLADREHFLIEGRVLGTIGRFFMHQRRLDEALPLLEQAVASHDSHLWREAGRSRLYLATALRMAGRLLEAAEMLEQASAGIDRLEREFSRPYGERTRLFWSYELSRLLLELDRPHDAEAVLERVLPRARQMGHWPLVGMLRTMAWAQDAESRSATLTELRARAVDPIWQRFVTEAEGPPRRDGEVF